MGFYEPRNIDAQRTSREYKMAVEESALYRGLLESNERSFMDYKEWAKENVSYQNFNSNDPHAQDQLSRKLQAHNDSYTISLLMNCITPLQHGMDIDSVLSAYLSYKVIMTANPDLSMNMSRMFSNMHGEAHMLADMVNIPGIHGLLNHWSKKLEKGMLNSSTEILGDEIKKAKIEHNLDSLVMSPRQVAALKINFMEQLYSDVRNCKGPEAELQKTRLLVDYSKALDHLNNISINSGFTMDVVAAEERYLVGLRMMEDPSYGNMFEQTGDYYGVKAVLDEDTGRWSGRFETRDGHEYNVVNPNELTQGAFTVRMPITGDFDEESSTGPRNLVKRRAKETAAMLAFLDAGNIDTKGVNQKAIEEAKAMVIKNFEAYKDNLASEFADDGYGDKDAFRAQIEKLADKAFNEVYPVSEEESEIDQVIQRFEGESQLVLGREAYIYSNPSGGPDVGANLRSDEARFAAWDKLTADANKYYDSDRSTPEVLNDLRKHMIAESSARDLYDYVMHIATNINQGPAYAYGTDPSRKSAKGPKPKSYTGKDVEKDEMQEVIDQKLENDYDNSDDNDREM